MEPAELVLLVGVALAILAGVGVAGYFLLRRWFERASARVADRIGLAVEDLVRQAAAASQGGRGYPGARVRAGRVTRLNAYAASRGLSEAEARREFVDSIERTARLMDAWVRLPVVGPVGLDAALGLFPVVGDAVAAAISVSLIARSLRYGVPPEIIARMLGNVLFDLLLGAIPAVGDLADLWFRANLRNIDLLRRYLDEEARDVIDVT